MAANLKDRNTKDTKAHKYITCIREEWERTIDHIRRLGL